MTPAEELGNTFDQIKAAGDKLEQAHEAVYGRESWESRIKAALEDRAYPDYCNWRDQIEEQVVYRDGELDTFTVPVTYDHSCSDSPPSKVLAKDRRWIACWVATEKDPDCPGVEQIIYRIDIYDPPAAYLPF